mgnify:CR=1 FL=1
MKKAEIYLEYMPYIDYAPKSPKQLHQEACVNDDITISSWRKTWEKNVKMNHELFGPFENKSIGKFYGKAHQKPVVIAGAGPSLKNNAHELKKRKDVTLVSCLHNFHFLEDIECPADYYVTLDAGEVTIEEVYEGGSKKEDEYWSITKDRKLLAYVGTSPNLLKKWQGEIYFYNAPVPDKDFMKYCDDIEIFNTYLSTGGNVLGASLYFAKAFLGASIIGFIGADFCFSYDKKFHAWNSKYDEKLGHVIRTKDVFGNSVYTWQSYHNFKGWFEYITLSVPGVYYNCSEGGTLGAYAEGNIRSIYQLPLADFLRQMNMYEEIEAQAKNTKVVEKKLLF